VIRFYETLISEIGSEIKITILIPGYVVSELTKGKALQKNGQVEINEDARDVHIKNNKKYSRENFVKILYFYQ
jgi:11beta/17beta-hydroxysteroid dehydrogenase